MLRTTLTLWTARLLFWLCEIIAGALIALVVLCPLIDLGSSADHGWSKALALFGHDAVLRRTAIASAVGLAVTAGIFFWPAARSRPRPRKRSKLPPSSADILGA
jgi:hypothetical protein